MRASGLLRCSWRTRCLLLREASLVSVREEGQHRYYSLSPAPLDEIDDWLVPFLVDDDDEFDCSPSSPVLTDSAAHAAEVVGRAAASAKHAVTNAFKKLPGR